MKKLSVLLLALLSYFTEVQSTIINVPLNYPTIQSAILAANNGDTIVVDPGTYFENINFRGRKVVLTSKYYLANDTSYICSTIINGSLPTYADTASCVIFNNGEDSTTVLQGFTLTGGKGTRWLDVHGAGTYREGGAIITEFASPIIRYNYIKGNFVNNTSGVSGTGGGGIRCGDGKPRIYNNFIAFNQARYGCGIVSNYCNGIEIKNNVIVNNWGGQSFGGGGVWATGTNTNTIVYVENNTIANNHIGGVGTYAGKGGGVFIFSVTMLCKNNIIWGNTQSSGNSIAAFLGGSVTATYSDINYVFPGTGNISANPMFVDTVNYILQTTSPCVDAGNPLAANDPTISANVAKFPSQGTELNDIGAFGGKLSVTLAYCPNIVTRLDKEGGDFNATFGIFPNPASDFISCNFSSHEKRVISIYSIAGKKMLEKELISEEYLIDTRSLEEGIYLVYLKTGGNPANPVKLVILRN